MICTTKGTHSPSVTINEYLLSGLQVIRIHDLLDSRLGKMQCTVPSMPPVSAYSVIHRAPCDQSATTLAIHDCLLGRLSCLKESGSFKLPTWLLCMRSEAELCHLLYLLPPPNLIHTVAISLSLQQHGLAYSSQLSNHATAW